MDLIYKGRRVQGEELKTPDGVKVIGYEIPGHGIVMPLEVGVVGEAMPPPPANPGLAPGSADAVPKTVHKKARRGNDPTLNP